MVMVLVLVVYIFAVLFFLSSTSLIMIIIFMELLSWIFVFSLPGVLIIKYLMVQGYFVVLMISAILWMPSVMTLGILLKMGLPPFQIWLMHFVSTLPISSFLLMSTMHKFLPLLILSKISFLFSGVFLNCVLLVVSTLLLFQSSLFFYMMVYSSMVHSVWAMMGVLVGKSFLLGYWAIYSIILIILMNGSSFIKVSSAVIGQGALTSFTWLMISGMPPFVLFWLKASLFISLTKFFSAYYSLLLLFSSVLALVVYFMAFHIALFSYSTSNYKAKMNTSMVLLVAQVFMF